MNMQELEQYAQQCLASNKPIKLLIEMPGFDAPELITNPPENIQKKLGYYKEIYDENCQHKHVKGIAIAGVVCETDISDVSTALLPFSPLPLQQGYIRYSGSSYVGEMSEDLTIEGPVEDVIKILDAAQRLRKEMN